MLVMQHTWKISTTSDYATQTSTLGASSSNGTAESETPTAKAAGAQDLLIKPTLFSKAVPP